MNSNKKVAACTGSTGQTASYLIEVLLNEGYEVYGLMRRSSSFSTGRIDHIYNHPNLHLVYGDLSDSLSIVDFVNKSKPDIFINAGAMSHVAVSFQNPEYTFDINATGTMRCLEAIRKYSPNTRFLQCSTSELFGSSPPPQNEQTPFRPRSPYSASKLAAWAATINYREAYNMFACNSISFNHESPRRGETFITRKITRGATRIKLRLQDKLVIGNSSARRDWLHAKDVAKAIYLMLAADKPEDYVIASGEMHSVQELIEMVFNKLDLDWKQYIEFDPKYLRPTEVDALCGDSTKIRTELGWKPEYNFEQLIDEMIFEDMKLAQKEKLIKDNS
jgi:GDPmannose 4,6-dehydratase